jgi:flagellar biosynthetic protein FliO
MKKTYQIHTGILQLAIMIIGLLAPADLFSQEKTSANTAVTIAKTSPENDYIQKPNAPVDGSTQSKKTFSTPAFLSNPWIALALVLILIIAGVWVLKRFHPGGNMLFGSLPVLQVLGRTHLSSKQTLVMVKVDNKLLLLGITDHQINPLMTIDSPEDVARMLIQIEQNRPAGISAGFKHFFSRENDLLQQNQTPSASVSDHSSDKNAETGVLQLKTELNTLLQKVQKLKRNGGDGSSV